MIQLEHKASSLSYETAQKQVAAYQKVVSHVWDIVNKAREEWEVESSARGGTQQNSSVADTHLLVAAVGMGKGLKVSTSNVSTLLNTLFLHRWFLDRTANHRVTRE